MTLIRRYLIGLCFALPVAAAESPTAPHGTEGGNGGNWVAAEFNARAWALADFLGQPGHNPHQIDLVALRKMLKELTVRTTSDRLLDREGKEVDAVNFFPDRAEIVLKRSVWIDYFFSEKDLSGLIYHELVPYFGRDDRDYHHARELMSLRRQSRPSLNVEVLLDRVWSDNRSLLSTLGKPPLAHDQAPSEPEQRDFLCYRLGEYGIFAALARRLAGDDLEIDPRPGPEDEHRLEGLADLATRAGCLVSFCKPQQMACPEEYILHPGDVAALVTHLKAQRDLITQLQTKP